MLRAERIDPCRHAEEASLILQEAWQPPCLQYTVDYLDWQFRFPGLLPACGVLVYEEQAPVGFIGATPRTLRLAESEQEVYVVSFLGVRPGWRGKGIASLLYHTLLESGPLTSAPIVSFAESDSTGERALHRSYSQASYTLALLEEYALYGYMPRLQGQEPAFEVNETCDPEAFIAAMRSGDDLQTLWNSPTQRILEHYLRDPRPRRLLLCRSKEKIEGCAMLLHAALNTPQGPGSAILLENIVVGENPVETLKALCASASQYGKETLSNGSVMLPNTRGISPETLKAVGLRQLPSRFRGYLCCFDPRNPFLQAAGTNLEII